MNVFRMSQTRGALPLAGLLALLGAASPVSASVTFDVDAAQDYCVSVGGQVQERAATWNTNSDPAQWVDLGRTMEMCRFKADDEAGSRIYVDLLTLWSESPSLAAAAYLAKVPMSDELPPGNPASYHCAGLGGSSQWGTGAAGGGWVDPDDPDDQVAAMCVFPDGSAIDEWGIAYYSGGVVRGADLAPLFRADSAAFPPIFSSSEATDAEAGDLDAASLAAEAQVSAAIGGVVEVTNIDGALTTIAFPAGSVSEDMTVVVTPLSEPTTDKGAPLTPGVLVEQKGFQGQHLQLARPAIVTFTITGEVPQQAGVVTFTDPETAQPLASSISKQGKSTMVTAFVSSFSETTVDGDPGEWGPLAPLTPDHRWSLSVSDTDSRTVQKIEMSLGAKGTLKSTALTGKFAFNGMSGPLDLEIAASFDEGPLTGTLEQHQDQRRGQAGGLLGPGGEPQEGHVLGARQRQPVRKRRRDAHRGGDRGRHDGVEGFQRALHERREDRCQGQRRAGQGRRQRPRHLHHLRWRLRLGVQVQAHLGQQVTPRGAANTARPLRHEERGWVRQRR